jgi:lipocalin
MTRIAPPPGLDLDRLLGQWQIIATTLPFWRKRSEPTVTYTQKPDGRWLDEVRFIGPPFSRRWHVGGENTVVAPPGRFQWRGTGLLKVVTSEWCVVAIDPEYRWAATWFSRVSFGITPEGWDLYARDPSFPESEARAALKTLMDTVAPRRDGWFFTTSAARAYGGRDVVVG